MLDIDRLHNNSEKSYFTSRSDRTTKMLVEAIQNTINKQSIVIVAHNMRYAHELRHKTHLLAEEMGYPIEYKNTHMLIDGVGIFFCSKQNKEQFILGRDCVIFEDHFCQIGF